jgi:hypothetical protein
LGTTICGAVASGKGMSFLEKTKEIATAIATNEIIVIFVAMDYFLAGGDLIPKAPRHSHSRPPRRLGALTFSNHSKPDQGRGLKLNQMVDRHLAEK